MMAKSKRNIEVSVILDRSGSMASVAEATVKGFNDYVKDLPSTTPVSLTQFDAPDRTTELVDTFIRQPAKGLKLKADDYRPRGATPLMDAIGITVDAIRQRKSKRDQVVLIVTDGLENASKDWTRERVRDLIADLRKKGWQFVFMGADIDAYSESAGIAMAASSTYGYSSTPASTSGAWSNASVGTRAYASATMDSVTMPDHDTSKDVAVKDPDIKPLAISGDI